MSSNKQPPCLLTIAGSDPSGGAGIQADLKTINSLGCYAATAITAITCQNSQGVSQIVPVQPELVAAQIQAVLDDLPISHIKIGMTASQAIVEAIASSLAGFSGEVIFDPVLRASSGALLLKEEQTALVPLLQISTVLTPNRLELEKLSNQKITTLPEAQQASQILLSQFPHLQALCIKGGHLAEDEAMIEDRLLVRSRNGGDSKTSALSFRHPRLTTKNSHGTGCTFASAFSAYHAHTGNYDQAFELAAKLVHHLLAEGSTIKLVAGNNGPLPHHLLGKKDSQQNAHLGGAFLLQDYYE